MNYPAAASCGVLLLRNKMTKARVSNLKNYYFAFLNFGI